MLYLPILFMKKMSILSSQKKRWLLPQLIAAICLFASFDSICQTRVSGTITDETKKPLTGVSVTVKGTKTGTTTDASGNYTIAVPNSNSILVFSYVGYASQEMPVGSNTNVSLSLAPSASVYFASYE